VKKRRKINYQRTNLIPQMTCDYGEPLEWYWQRKIEDQNLGEKSVPVPLLCTSNSTWTDPGANRCVLGLRRPIGRAIPRNILYWESRKYIGYTVCTLSDCAKVKAEGEGKKISEMLKVILLYIFCVVQHQQDSVVSLVILENYVICILLLIR
jgi:hypothetical protein